MGGAPQTPGQEPLGFCTDCVRTRWLAVVDGTYEGGVPYGTCTQCAREAEFDGPQLYFAFGMNLDPAYMEGCEKVGPATLPGWRMRFRYFATVERCGCVEAYGGCECSDEVKVYGGVWKVPPAEMLMLDGREGYPRMYGREKVTVDLPWDTVEAWVYTLGTNPPPVGPPDEGYLDMIKRGYEYFGLGDEALAELERTVRAAEVAA